MKKIGTLIALVVVSLLMTSCGDNNAASKVKKENVVNAQKRDVDISQGSPTISFDKTIHDFGTVTEGDIVNTTFVVTNTGNSNLVFTNASSSCGCTIPTWPKHAIKPGESADIKVRFNTNGKPNKQSKTVNLYTNTLKGVETVKIKGFVTPKKRKTKKGADKVIARDIDIEKNN